MKSAFKILLVFFLTIGLLGAAALAIFYFTPSLQKKLAVSVIERATGEPVEMEYFRAGFTATTIRGFQLDTKDQKVALDSMEAQYSIGGLLAGTLMIHSVNIEGLDLNLAAGAVRQAGDTETKPADQGSPGLKLHIPVSIGEFTMDGIIRLPQAQTVQMELKLENLMPGEVATLAADLKTWGMEANGRTRELNLTASGDLTQTPSGDLERFVLKAEVDRFSVEEWQPFFGGKPAEEAPSEIDRTPDTHPAWAGLVGEIEARLDILEFEGNSMEDVTARMTLSKEGELVFSAAARSGATPLKLDGTLAFNKDQSRTPYSLSGAFKVQELDVTPFLKTSPSDPNPMLEGVFNLDGNFQSSSPNLGLIAEKLHGEANLTSVGTGKFRPLGENTSMASGVSGILGALGGSVKELNWVREVINQLKEIPYSEMTFSVAREPSLDIALRQLDLISRETRIKGQGTISYTEGVSLLEMPMDLKFQLFAKGRLAEALRTGGQLRSQEADALGFMPGPPLPVKGTLGTPESLLKNLFLESTPGLLPGLFGN